MALDTVGSRRIEPIFPWQVPPSPWQKFRRAPAEFLIRWLNERRTTRADDTSSPQGVANHPIRIVCISDTHNMQPRVPVGDILLHAGDLTDKGTFEELQAQLHWLNSLPHTRKIVIAGNHDRLLDPEYVAHFPDRIHEGQGASRSDLDWGELIYLNDDSVKLDFPGNRTLSIYGSPLTEQYGTFAFQYPPIREVWHAKILDDTDVLLVHGPPRGYLDNDGKGCPQLLKEIWRVRPRLVVFGHIHVGYGQRLLQYDDGAEAAYASVLMGSRGLLAVVSMVWYSVSQKFRRLLPSFLTRSTDRSYGVFVNAALMGHKDGEGIREPLVVQL